MPTLTAMREMRLLDRALAMRTHLNGMSMLDIDGNEISRTEECTISAGRLNSGDIEILRDDLAGLLLSASEPGATYLFGDTITALQQDDSGGRCHLRTSTPSAIRSPHRCRRTSLEHP